MWFRMSRLVADTTIEDRQTQPSSTRNLRQEEFDKLSGVVEPIQEDPADFQRVRLLPVEVEGLSMCKEDATFDHEIVNEQAQKDRVKEARHPNIQNSSSSQPRYSSLTSAALSNFFRRSGPGTMTPRVLPSHSRPRLRSPLTTIGIPHALPSLALRMADGYSEHLNQNWAQMLEISSRRDLPIPAQSRPFILATFNSQFQDPVEGEGY